MGIAAVVALMVLAPVLASLLSPAPLPAESIKIDSEFGDWSLFAAYADSPADERSNPDVNLVSMKVAAKSNALFVYARVDGLLFRGAGTNGTDSLFVFVDEDGDPATGYPIRGLGADGLAELHGWGGTVYDRNVYAFDATRGAASDDWSRFLPKAHADFAFRGSEIEMGIPLDSLPTDAKILLVLADNRGGRDVADGAVAPQRPTVVLDQRTVAPDVVSSLRTPFLRATLVPLGGAPSVLAVNVTRLGTSADSTLLAVYADDGDGTLDAGDRLVSTTALQGVSASLPMTETLSRPQVYWIEAQWTTMTAASTFGLRVDDLTTNGTVSLRASETGLAYLGTAPATLAVDGAFGDWSGRAYGQDLLGDVANRTGSVAYNANVDLLATAVDVGANFTAYARVDGRILGGEDLPVLRARTATTSIADADLDGVPDAVEILLPNAGLRNDFNNDNVTDDRTNGDVDADGIVDYGEDGGADLWLNTTIPNWYPAPYASRAVSRYIGSIAPAVQEGLDVLYVYLDADNSTATGLVSDLDGVRYGFDESLAVLGRNGRIVSRGLYAYAAGNSTPWRFLGSIDAALDAHRIELGVDSSLLGLGAGYRAVFVASDWRLSSDGALPDAVPARFPVSSQAVATTVVINEVSPSPNPEWVEVANPTASAVNLAGWDVVVPRGNKMVVIYAFTNQILGAWGSGSEYLSVSPTPNSLPNGNVQVSLRRNGVVIDSTTYVASVGNGKSWARFKDPTSGVPTDNNNDATDFYVSLIPSPGRANDRHRPTVAVAKAATRMTAVPGDALAYTIFYNNTGTGLARTVWINDTLPAGVTFVGSSVAPTTVVGSTYGWVLTNVAPTSANSLTIAVQVNGNGADASLQSNAVTLAYTDQLQRPMVGSRAWANFTLFRPTVLVAKVVSPANALPGDTVTFTIYYNNTGSRTAGTVSIRDILPSGLNYTGSNPAPSGISGRSLWWNFTNVAPGAHSLTITTLVSPFATGTQLVNWAFLNYTTTNGYSLAPSSASAIVSIPELSDFLFVAAVPFLLLGLRRWKTRREKEEGVADSVPWIGGR